MHGVPDARQAASQHYLDVMLACYAISLRTHERLAYCWRHETPPTKKPDPGYHPFNRLLALPDVPESQTIPQGLDYEAQSAFYQQMEECARYTAFPLKFELGRFMPRPSIRDGFERYELLLEESQKLEVLALMAAEAKPAKRRREDEEEVVAGVCPSPKRARAGTPPSGEAAGEGLGQPPSDAAANRSIKRKGGGQGGREAKKAKVVVASDRQLRPRQPKQPAKNL
ncbi:hypothetical protein ABW21_db0202643 [Orbilia brochopaga]|nr:hypothetical protein ABW21_db0202643 [Drechslerella brochopaga]